MTKSSLSIPPKKSHSSSASSHVHSPTSSSSVAAHPPAHMNGVHLPNDFFKSNRTHSFITGQVSQFEKFNINYQFADLSMVNEYGELPTSQYKTIPHWIHVSKEVAPEQKILASIWCSQEGHFLNTSVHSEIVASCESLLSYINDNGHHKTEITKSKSKSKKRINSVSPAGSDSDMQLDGIMIGCVDDDEEGLQSDWEYTQLLGELRYTLGDNFMLAVTAPSNEENWSAEHIYSIAPLVDMVCPPLYNSGSTNQTDYINWANRIITHYQHLFDNPPPSPSLSSSSFSSLPPALHSSSLGSSTTSSSSPSVPTIQALSIPSASIRNITTIEAAAAAAAGTIETTETTRESKEEEEDKRRGIQRDDRKGTKEEKNIISSSTTTTTTTTITAIDVDECAAAATATVSLSPTLSQRSFQSKHSVSLVPIIPCFGNNDDHLKNHDPKIESMIAVSKAIDDALERGEQINGVNVCFWSNMTLKDKKVFKERFLKL